MTRTRVIGTVITGATAATASVALAQDSELKSKLQELLPGMGVEKIPDRRNSQQAWQEICFQAGAPGNEAQRVEVCQLMVDKIGPDMPGPARVWLIKQLERIGRAECVDALAAALPDKDPHVRDGARRALANNPAPEANAKLLAEMQATKDNRFKVGLLNSLGFRADPASVAAVAKELSNKDAAVAAAAARALGKIAGPEAAKALDAARNKTTGDVRLRVVDSYLLCADSLVKQGQAKEAVAIYSALNKPEESESVRLAAMQGLLNAARK